MRFNFSLVFLFLFYCHVVQNANMVLELVIIYNSDCDPYSFVFVLVQFYLWFLFFKFSWASSSMEIINQNLDHLTNPSNPYYLNPNENPAMVLVPSLLTEKLSWVGKIYLCKHRLDQRVNCSLLKEVFLLHLLEILCMKHGIVAIKWWFLVFVVRWQFLLLNMFSRWI